MPLATFVRILLNGQIDNGPEAAGSLKNWAVMANCPARREANLAALAEGIIHIRADLERYFLALVSCGHGRGKLGHTKRCRAPFDARRADGQAAARRPQGDLCHGPSRVAALVHHCKCGPGVLAVQGNGEAEPVTLKDWAVATAQIVRRRIASVPCRSNESQTRRE